jgi:hypothetical protein
MTRKWINVAAFMLIAFGASASGVDRVESAARAINYCEGGGQSCYCSGACQASGSGCSCL